MKTIKVKPMINKNTKQISICIPKRKLPIFQNKDKIPKSMKIKIEEVEWFKEGEI